MTNIEEEGEEDGCISRLAKNELQCWSHPQRVLYTPRGHWQDVSGELMKDATVQRGTGDRMEEEP